jgi:hypothetical protein
MASRLNSLGWLGLRAPEADKLREAVCDLGWSLPCHHVGVLRRGGQPADNALPEPSAEHARRDSRVVGMPYTNRRVGSRRGNLAVLGPRHEAFACTHSDAGGCRCLRIREPDEFGVAFLLLRVYDRHQGSFAGS